MKLTNTKQKRRFLVFLPVMAIPFLCLVFHTLGGGRGVAKAKSTNNMGLNTQLPALPFDLQKAFQDKLKTYEQAATDSVRKAQWERQDPYHQDTMVAWKPPVVPPVVRLVVRPVVRPVVHPVIRPSLPLPLSEASVVSPPAPDPQLDRINALLDKVIRIQHPQERGASPAPAPVQPAEEVLPADSTANSIAAIIPADQTLTAGATLTLRIMDSLRVGGRTLAAGQLIYGPVMLDNDRLLVHIGSLREDRNLYQTDWQVFDLDGLEGIHIPGLLGRDVAKQSADRAVNGLNIMTLDPSLGAQAAGAGIQAAKSFLGHKVRQVSVTVRAGYQVLLRNPRAREIRPMVPAVAVGDPVALLPPPELGRVLERCRDEGMELSLRTIAIRDSCLWFGLEWSNHSPIAYIPAYARWYVRDRRVFRRTALQEQGLEPLVAHYPSSVGSDSALHSFTAFRPFALPRDKELVLEIGEKGGGRTLHLVISPREILKAKIDAKVSQQ